MNKILAGRKRTCFTGLLLIGLVLCSDKHYFIEKKCRIRVGAMIFVVVEDLIPDAHLSEHPHFGTWGAMLGFAVMMVLDVALG